MTCYTSAEQSLLEYIVMDYLILNSPSSGGSPLLYIYNIWPAWERLLTKPSAGLPCTHYLKKPF